MDADHPARGAGQGLSLRRRGSARGSRHRRYVAFDLAEVAVPRMAFAEILHRIDRLRGPPVAVA